MLETDRISYFTGFALNVWVAEEDEIWIWKMAIYPVTETGIDTSVFIPINPTVAQIERYLQITKDSDWWVNSADPDFAYILWDGPYNHGTREHQYNA